jgi:undecaprenyl-diphosphatase
VELLFGNPYLIAAGLGTVGVMIMLSGMREAASRGKGELRLASAAWIGAVQGLCLPFRGFSRSGATISTGLFLGLDKQRVEEFSFALVVVLTPAVVLKEGYRLLKAQQGALAETGSLFQLAWPSVLGMSLSFIAGLAALRWLSRWLENGRWHWFGYYCMVAAVVTLAIGTR